MKGLRGKNVLVTGGSSGIGQSIAVVQVPGGVSIGASKIEAQIDIHIQPIPEGVLPRSHVRD